MEFSPPKCQKNPGNSDRYPSLHRGPHSLRQALQEGLEALCQDSLLHGEAGLAWENRGDLTMKIM
jgi:hypothetical protein